VQTPQYRLNSIEALFRTPITPIANTLNGNTPGAANPTNAFVGTAPS